MNVSLTTSRQSKCLGNYNQTSTTLAKGLGPFALISSVIAVSSSYFNPEKPLRPATAAIIGLATLSFIFLPSPIFFLAAAAVIWMVKTRYNRSRAHLQVSSSLNNIDSEVSVGPEELRCCYPNLGPNSVLAVKFSLETEATELPEASKANDKKAKIELQPK